VPDYLHLSSAAPLHRYRITVLPGWTVVIRSSFTFLLRILPFCWNMITVVLFTVEHAACTMIFLLPVLYRCSAWNVPFCHESFVPFFLPSFCRLVYGLPPLFLFCLFCHHRSVLPAVVHGASCMLRVLLHRYRSAGATAFCHLLLGYYATMPLFSWLCRSS
jgi:hypothetical protein